MAKTDTYIEVGTIIDSGAIVHILEPDISDEENERRLKQLHDETARFLMSRGRGVRGR